MTLVLAALWGFAGAVPYAGTKLVTALWGSSDVEPRERALAVAQFAIAMFTGPAAAAALAPWLIAYVPGAPLAAVAGAVGLISNAAWPLITDRAFLSRALIGFGGWLMRLGQDAADPSHKAKP